MSKYDAWLRDCAAAGYGGVRMPALQIDRGLAYSKTISVPLDLSADTFFASLRIDPDSTGATAGDFTVTAGSYTAGATVLTLAMDVATTAALPADDAGEGVVDLAFDLLRRAGGSGNRMRFIAGVIPVSGKVTNNV